MELEGEWGERRGRPADAGGRDVRVQSFSAAERAVSVPDAGQVAQTPAADIHDLNAAQQNLQQRLREAEAQFAAVLENAMDAIVAVDEDRRVLLFNPAAEHLFGLRAADVIGRRGGRLLPMRLRPGLRNIMEGLSAPDTCRRGPLTALRANGKEFPIEASAWRGCLNGKTVYTVILRDPTARRQSVKMLHTLSRIVEQSAETVCITDRDGRIEYVNAAFEQQTGYTREEAIGRTPAILKSGEHDNAFYSELWTTLLSGDVFRGVFKNRKKNGQLYYDLQTITPIRDDHGAISHFVAGGRDITHRKLTEEALLRLNAQLEREAERIAHALHDDAGQFLTAAHITLADVARDLPPQAQQRVNEVREHLNRVEEHLRGLSRELRPRILEDLGLPAALAFLAKGVMQRAEIPVSIEVTLNERLAPIVETTLYRLVQEALTNATRHARATRIEVCLAREGRTIRCAIRDNGVGFDAAQYFARRGESSLGLIGTRDRLQALGGTLQIDSIPGQGTALLVLIPLEP